MPSAQVVRDEMFVELIEQLNRRKVLHLQYKYVQFATGLVLIY